MYMETIKNTNTIIEIPIKEMQPFKNHPFKINDDAKMQELVESIKYNGILVPGVVRPLGKGEYEIISGHRRKRACELLNLKTMPVYIKEYTDDDAVVAMIDSNIQREGLLPSEKAFAYKMKYLALTHQGIKTDISSTQVGWKNETAHILGETFGESKNQVRRYIRLTELIPELLNMVDQKKIKLVPAVDLSFLTKIQQEILVKVIKKDDVYPSIEQAQRLKQLGKDKIYSKETVHAVLLGSTGKKRQFSLKYDSVRKYFNEDESDEDIEKIIYGLLENWAERRKYVK